MGAARWLCSGHRPEGSAWIDGHTRDLLAPARCADLPPAASAACEQCSRRGSACLGARLWLAVMTPTRTLRCDRTMRWLRAELRTVPFLRSRPLGPMLTAPPGELWPFRARFFPSSHFGSFQPLRPRPLEIAGILPKKRARRRTGEDQIAKIRAAPTLPPLIIGAKGRRRRHDSKVARSSRGVSFLAAAAVFAGRGGSGRLSPRSGGCCGPQRTIFIAKIAVYARTGSGLRPPSKISHRAGARQTSG